MFIVLFIVVVVVFVLLLIVHVGRLTFEGPAEEPLQDASFVCAEGAEHLVLDTALGEFRPLECGPALRRELDEMPATIFRIPPPFDVVQRFQVVENSTQLLASRESALLRACWVAG